MSNQTQQEPQTLSADPNTAIQSMMESIDHLLDVYVRETDALDKADTDLFMTLQDEKLVAARFYESGITQLLARKDEMKKARPDLRSKLIKMQGEFAELSEKNLTSLDRMKRSVDRLGGTLRTAARDAARKERIFTYGKNGHIDSNKNRAISTGFGETA